MALLFGVVVTFQVLSLEVTSRLPEYATLKAMGYRDRFLSRVVLQQAFTFAGVSYVLGFVVALAIYLATRAATKLPVGMTAGRAAGVLILTLLMCSVSGLLALRVVRRAEPAELFR
jgi:putative ABC transport system permease protein